ncbi:hypothetical protein [Microbulbifer elongatus]|uniref:Uncharacterized protein n=1 Tax=Microbulbifer elongatus TaxID=86173 RepID=A0ABT1P332_9GAMM|nr:hypothetical protein [Microbulbifer elongatus]MCQ3830533.1 hypothetical protein [Microbulbifer elongatus]
MGDLCCNSQFLRAEKVPPGLANFYDILLILMLDFFSENRIMDHRELILTWLKTGPSAKLYTGCTHSHQTATSGDQIFNPVIFSLQGALPSFSKPRIAACMDPL